MPLKFFVEVFGCDFFLDSVSLVAYVKEHNVVTWHGDVGIGNLTFIDTPNLHVVFSSRSDYEKWCSDGQPVSFQLSLF